MCRSLINEKLLVIRKLVIGFNTTNNQFSNNQ